MGTLIIMQTTTMLMTMDLSWVFHMLEHEVDSKDVHVLEDSSNPNAPAHCQVSEDDLMLTFLISFAIDNQTYPSVGSHNKGLTLSFLFCHLTREQRQSRSNLSLSWGSDPRGIAALSRESAIRRAGSSFWLLIRIMMVVMMMMLMKSMMIIVLMKMMMMMMVVMMW